jgi:methylthioribose-1-phosphate isomerase
MQVRGAPLIGATAAYGWRCARRDDASDARWPRPPPCCGRRARPRSICTGRWRAWKTCSRPLPRRTALRRRLGRSRAIAEEDVAQNAAIGQHGLAVARADRRRRPG